MPIKEHGTVNPIRIPMLKRPFDVALSLIGLIGSSFLFAIFSILIIVEDGFPVFIRQGRIGKKGRIFKSIKFRSMTKDALNEEVSRQACEEDARVTKVGCWLRKIAMDELPQLYNILLGEMSFVGPRALLPVEIETGPDNSRGAEKERIQHINDIPGYEERIRVLPGLTGIAQIYAPRDLPRREKFKYDLLYIRSMSFWTDVRLILMSFLISFSGTWEKRGAKLRALEKHNNGPLRGRD